MKMILKSKTIVFITILTIFFSCKKAEQYSNNFSIKNESKYKIENMEIQLAGSKKTLVINPMSTSETFTLNYENTPTYPFSAALELSYFIETYSDSSKTYKNNIGRTYPQNKLKPNNIITIKVDSTAITTNIFTLTFD